MKIEDELAKNFAIKVYNVCFEVARDAHCYIEKNLSSYYKYPVSVTDHLLKSEAFDELKNNIDFLKYKIPKFHLEDFPGSLMNYNAIFNGYQSDKIKISDYESYRELKGWVEQNERVQMLLTHDEDVDCEYNLKCLISECVERYLFLTKATSTVPEDIEERLKDIVEQALRYYLEEKLNIDICVPICLAIFEQDNIKLSDAIEIVKIPDEVQKARQKACSYEVIDEDWVAACATHMIVFHDYFYNNVDEFSINAATQDYNCYPLKEIDKIFGVIRLVTGYSIGYEQILCRPIGWMYNACADLPIVYGAKAHFINPKEIKKYWSQITVSIVTQEQCEEIEELYKDFLKCENKISFSLSRYNRCMLRDEIDDMSTDACIGLESLLAGGTKGEITYTISNRIPIVFAKSKDDRYSAENCRSIMKKIYSFRSKIVHGGELKEKEKYIISGEERWYIPNVAVDFLRHVLVFMIKNPQFLDATKIDEYIDSVIYSSFES